MYIIIHSKNMDISSNIQKSISKNMSDDIIVCKQVENEMLAHDPDDSIFYICDYELFEDFLLKYVKNKAINPNQYLFLLQEQRSIEKCNSNLYENVDLILTTQPSPSVIIANIICMHNRKRYYENIHYQEDTKGILLIEEEKIILIDMKRRLQRNGFIVAAEAANAEEANKILLRLRPSMIVSDYFTCGKVDDVENATELKSRIKIPFMFVTSYSDRKTFEHMGNSGIDLILLKPFREHELMWNLQLLELKYGINIHL